MNDSFLDKVRAEHDAIVNSAQNSLVFSGGALVSKSDVEVEGALFLEDGKSILRYFFRADSVPGGEVVRVGWVWHECSGEGIGAGWSVAERGEVMLGVEVAWMRRWAWVFGIR